MRIIKTLEKAGIVKIYRGASGGYKLIESKENNRDIIEIIDDDIVLQACIDSKTICNHRGSNCTIKIALAKLQFDLLEDFDKINFYDLVNTNPSK